MDNIVSISNRRYLGSKYKLLSFINDIVERECDGIKSVADIFAGTGAVALLFKKEKKHIIINDSLFSNRIIYEVFFGKQRIRYNYLKKIVAYYNQINPYEDNYFSEHFSDNFFSKTNARKIGAIREDIENMFEKKEINEREKAYLVSSLLFAADKIANTVGHFDAFMINGDLDKKLVLPNFDYKEICGNTSNSIFCEDANDLVKHIKADLIYVDPPYNSRQYSSTYHLLENLAKWEKPEVIGVARKMVNNTNKSRYSLKQAPIAFSNLINDIQSKYVLVSYNNMGKKGNSRSQAKISDQEILAILSKKGNTKVFETEHHYFSAGKTKLHDHKERLFLCEVGKFGAIGYQKRKTEGLIKSPLNYTGGKFKILKQILPYLTKSHTLIDLFGGGFNVGINADSKQIIYNDKQKEVTRLIKLFKNYDSIAILNKLDENIHKYSLSQSFEKSYSFYGCNSDDGLGQYNKTGYYELRKHYNEQKESDEKDFSLLTLVIFTFNNQIRFNSKGEFNLPVGKRDLNKAVRNNIIRFSDKLKNISVEFHSKDFEEINPSLYKDVVLYCDPPYLLGKASYNENDGWTDNDETRLLNYLSRISRAGHKFALSNFTFHMGIEHTQLTSWINENGYFVREIISNYSNANYHKSKFHLNSKEVLITNFPI